MFLCGIAEAADDAVGGALLLDLDHRPLARAIVLRGALGDYAVERTAAALEPGEGRIPVVGYRRQVEPALLILAEEPLQLLASLRQWLARQGSSLQPEQVEQHQLGRGFLRQLADAALSRMQPQLECFKRK